MYFLFSINLEFLQYFADIKVNELKNVMSR